MPNSPLIVRFCYCLFIFQNSNLFSFFARGYSSRRELKFLRGGVVVHKGWVWQIYNFLGEPRLKGMRSLFPGGADTLDDTTYLCCHKNWHRNLSAYPNIYSHEITFLLKGNSKIRFNYKNDLTEFKGLRKNGSFV